MVQNQELREVSDLSGPYIVFSDIQGSINYLDRFFKATQTMRKVGTICLGDIVDRMDQFSDNRCIEAVREKSDFCIKGNHEENRSTKTTEKVTDENLGFLKGLPKFTNLGNVLLFHSSVRSDGLRLFTKDHLKMEGDFIKSKFPNARFALFGHTHIRGAYAMKEDEIKPYQGDTLNLDPSELTLINPGGIGLLHGLPKTFARIDFTTGKLNFITLEQAESMAYRADLVNAFDQRWMPDLNTDSYGWFSNFAKKDAAGLAEKCASDPLIGKLAYTLRTFDDEVLRRTGDTRKKKYLEGYSLDLANCVGEIKKTLDELYEVKDPHQSRREFLSLRRQRY